MFLLLSRYLKPVEEIDRVLPEHRAFLDRHYEAGDFLVSGPLEPRTGGVIVTFPMSRERVESILAHDPFVREGVSKYDIIEFKPTKRTEVLAQYVPLP
jgi:uncharacterized protein YciI